MKGSERELPILWQQQQRRGVRAVSNSSIENQVLFIPLLTELHGSLNMEVPSFVQMHSSCLSQQTLFHWSGQSFHKEKPQLPKAR